MPQKINGGLLLTASDLTPPIQQVAETGPQYLGYLKMAADIFSTPGVQALLGGIGNCLNVKAGERAASFEKSQKKRRETLFED